MNSQHRDTGLLKSTWLATLLAGALLSSCGQQPQSGRVLDEARAAGRTAASFPHAADDYFHDMDGGVALTPRGNPGPQHVVGLDRRQRPLLEPDDAVHLRCLRPAEGHQLASRSRLFTRQPLGLPRTGQRAVLRASQPVPTSSATACGSMYARPIAPPIRSKTKVAIRALRPARAASRWRWHDAAGGLVLRLRHRHHGTAAVPQPRLRREGRQGLGSGALLHRPAYYNRTDLVRPYRVGMSCGFCHVGPEPGQSAGRSRAPAFANLSSSVGAQYMWVDRLFIFNSNQPEARRTSCTSW